ncbi:MAG: hypothetical protein MZV70_63665 [Desulfobacterales bacterium]|nr:hypothetical protein [Desulfobacterales bacterium]
MQPLSRVTDRRGIHVRPRRDPAIWRCCCTTRRSTKALLERARALRAGDRGDADHQVRRRPRDLEAAGAGAARVILVPGSRGGAADASIRLGAPGIRTGGALLRGGACRRPRCVCALQAAPGCAGPACAPRSAGAGTGCDALCGRCAHGRAASAGGGR